MKQSNPIFTIVVNESGGKYARMIILIGYQRLLWKIRKEEKENALLLRKMRKDAGLPVRGEKL